MDAGQLKNNLSLNDILDLLHEVGAEPISRGNQIACRTVCHGGHKHKLIYYHESKTFTCFTGDCGHGFDVYILLQKIYGLSFTEAYRYLAGKFNINMSFNYDRVDVDFIKKFENNKKPIVNNEIPKTLLNRYYNFYHKLWVEDGISIETMRKFNIMFSIKENKIIIPHFDTENRLIGVRGRALNEEEIEAGRKYMPVYHPKGGVLKHLTGGNIYGLNVTKESISKNKTIILFESEKGPQQLDTMLPEMSIGGGISGSYLTDEQVKILKDLDVENVVLGLDKEFTENGTAEELFYKRKIKSGFIDKLLPYFHVQILWDTENLLDYKSAPTDHGKETFIKLWKNRIFI